jgi:hypothetical protein
MRNFRDAGLGNICSLRTLVNQRRLLLAAAEDAFVEDIGFLSVLKGLPLDVVTFDSPGAIRARRATSRVVSCFFSLVSRFVPLFDVSAAGTLALVVDRVALSYRKARMRTTKRGARRFLGR